MKNEPLTSSSDEQLYDLLCGAHDAAHPAFNELYRRYSPRIYTYCRKILGDASLADDAFQETFVRFYNSAQKERKMMNVSAFLLRIARNLCLSMKKRKDYSTISLDETYLPVIIPRSYESSELLQLIEMAMETLPEDQREVLILREQLGLSYNEIAEVLQTTLPVVRTRLFRAKGKLARFLHRIWKTFSNSTQRYDKRVNTMDDPLSFSELLSAFLDNELDGPETNTLFYMLAHNQELQTEMREQLMLRSALQTPLLLPPEHLHAGILARIASGESDPQPTTTQDGAGPIAAVRSIFGNRLLIAIISAAVGALGLYAVIESNRMMPGALYVDTSGSRVATVQVGHGSQIQKRDGSGIIAAQQTTSASSPKQVPAAEAHLAASPNNMPRLKQMQATSSSGSLRSDRARSKQLLVALPNPSDRATSTSGVDDRSTADSVTATQLRSLSILAPTEEHIVLKKLPLDSISLSESVQAPPSLLSRFSVAVRGNISAAWPSTERVSPADQFMNNGSVALSYAVADYHSISMEFGQNLLPELVRPSEATKPPRSATQPDSLHHNNHVEQWIGVGYQYAFDPSIESLQLSPFVGAVVGGTHDGPMGRMTVGIRVHDNPSFIIGGEGSLFLYRSESAWLSTKTIGITYGISFHF